MSVVVFPPPRFRGFERGSREGRGRVEVEIENLGWKQVVRNSLSLGSSSRLLTICVRGVCIDDPNRGIQLLVGRGYSGRFRGRSSNTCVSRLIGVRCAPSRRFIAAAALSDLFPPPTEPGHRERKGEILAAKLLRGESFRPGRNEERENENDFLGFQKPRRGEMKRNFLFLSFFLPTQPPPPRLFSHSLAFAACDAAIHFLSTSPAFPDLWISCARATPPSGVPSAAPAAARATPAFRFRASATAPRAPPKTSLRMAALRAASPPLRSSIVQGGMPSLRGSSL